MNKNLFISFSKIIFIVLFIAFFYKFSAMFNLYRLYSYIDYCGESFYIMPAYKSVSAERVLNLNGIKIGKDKIVNYDLKLPIEPAFTLEIVKVSQKIRKEKKEIPFRVLWSRQYSSNLRTVELQKGVEKTILSDIAEIFHNDILKNSEVLRQRSIAKEYFRLVLLTKDGQVEKIYDLSKADRINMTATAYYPGDPLAWGDGTITFLGQKMQRGIVAVDPSVIPLRTRVFVSGFGYGYAGDTGNAIKGNRIDLGVNNAEEEKPWMFRDVVVYILEPSNAY
ncbi:MAG: 3D domain-containing protein [Elusimicrobiota bacterium]|nr:3D domain-containing protein [Elusimicrobiota bacterium]